MKSFTHITGSLLGTALGDSLGLPSEGMNRKRIAKRWKGPLEQRFLFGHGMLSDDTEHTIISAQALILCGGNVVGFQKLLGRKLRWWFAGLPAGVGLATAKAIIKLWMGFKPGRNGIYSAGNGPVMRAPIIGACFPKDPEMRRQFVQASALLTHTDPKAFEAALMAADCTAFATTRESDPEIILGQIKAIATAPEWRHPIEQIEASLKSQLSVTEFAERMGFTNGVSGYAVHTMTMVIFIWLRHRGDFSRIVSEAIACGGDTDSVAAIAGGIAGAETGSFDDLWIKRLCDRPYTVAYIERLGETLTRSGGTIAIKPPFVANFLIIPRNLLFFFTVITHGFRRVFPPY